MEDDEEVVFADSNPMLFNKYSKLDNNKKSWNCLQSHSKAKLVSLFIFLVVAVTSLFVLYYELRHTFSNTPSKGVCDALDPQQPLIQPHLLIPSNFISLNSTEGTQLLQCPKTVSQGFWSSFQHLTTQDTTTYCSIATSVTLLNALFADTAPVDPVYSPYAYWTQANFFSPCTEAITPQESVKTSGLTLDGLAGFLHCHNVSTRVFKGNQTTISEFRSILSNSLGKGEFVAYNFLRSALLESGGGHFSPILAINQERDLALLADVARYKYPPAWISISELYRAMNTLDSTSKDFRGFIVLFRS